MRLAELVPGERAIISGDAGDARVNRRLLDLGLVPGTRLEVTARHLFGGPMVIRVGGAHIAIGARLARLVPVERLPGRGRPRDRRQEPPRRNRNNSGGIRP